MSIPCLTHFYLDKESDFYLPEITYFTDGKVKSEKYFTDGQKLIKEKIYNEQGTLIEIVNYISDGKNKVLYFDKEETEKRSGIALTYHENGKVQSQRYFVNGKIHWQEKIFSEAGNLLEFISYDKGGKSGPYIMYDERGNKIKEINYEDNIPSGITKLYYENGQLKAEVNYKDGKKNGITKIFYNNGTLKIVENNINDIREGITKTYYESGGIKEEWNFSRGAPEGNSKFFYKSGALFGTKNYKSGMEEGLTQLFYEDGIVKEEINYVEGKKHGSNRIYDTSGKLIKELVFTEGVCEKEIEPKIEIIPVITEPLAHITTFREKTILTINYVAVSAVILAIIYLIYFLLISV
ncbi:MAG: toxin-antitoxin system YwqK family antitoxin [bacterium]